MSSEPRRMVIALGGNAICKAGMAGNIPEQFSCTREAVIPLADMVEQGHRILLVHGNGPQVGNILRRVEIASRDVYPIDLGLCVADTQAGMGYMISQCMMNELRRRGCEQLVSTIITSVLVDHDDPAFTNPTKPIGPYFSAEEAKAHAHNDGWSMVEVPDRGWRRVVPSPKPRQVRELQLIRKLFDEDFLVIAAGGGGIPVVDTPGFGYEGVEAVIDKDLTAAVLALGVDADLLAILTEVPNVCLDFGKPSEKPLSRLTISEAKRYSGEGQFPAGSMAPKIEAGIFFLEQSAHADARVLIASTGGVSEAMTGDGGTWLVRDAD